jgi:hypothetical protein
MTEKERNERFTKQALAHTDWNYRPLEPVVTKEIEALPKNATGQVIIPDNLSEDKLIVFKSVMTPKRVVSAFANAPVVNAFTNF